MHSRRKASKAFFVFFTILLLTSSQSSVAQESGKSIGTRYFVIEEQGYVNVGGNKVIHEEKHELILDSIRIITVSNVQNMNVSYRIFDPENPSREILVDEMVGASNFRLTALQEKVGQETVISNFDISFTYFRYPRANFDILGSDFRRNMTVASFELTRHYSSLERIWAAFSFKKWNGEGFDNVNVEFSADNDENGVVKKIGIHILTEDKNMRPIQEYHFTMREMTWYERTIKSNRFVREIGELWFIWLITLILIMMVYLPKRMGRVKKWIIVQLGGTLPQSNGSGQEEEPEIPAEGISGTDGR